MIKDLGIMNLEAHVKDDEFDSLINYMIEINGLGRGPVKKY